MYILYTLNIININLCYVIYIYIYLERENEICQNENCGVVMVDFYVLIFFVFLQHICFPFFFIHRTAHHGLGE